MLLAIQIINGFSHPIRMSDHVARGVVGVIVVSRIGMVAVRHLAELVVVVSGLEAGKLTLIG